MKKTKKTALLPQNRVEKPETVEFAVIYGGFEQTQAKRRKLQVFLQFTALLKAKPEQSAVNYKFFCNLRRLREANPSKAP